MFTSKRSRSAFSANIKERRDFSCALFDAAGRMVSQAAHIPIHLGSVPLCVAAAMQALGPDGWEPGDAVILNDPYRGGTHLPDVTLVSPVFLGGPRPAFYVANRAHHADVGGAHPDPAWWKKSGAENAFCDYVVLHASQRRFNIVLHKLIFLPRQARDKHRKSCS